MTSLPDIGKAAQLLKFSVEIPEQIKGEGFLQSAIVQGIYDGKIKQVVKEVKQMAADNYSVMEEIIGKELLNEIINY